MRVSSPELALLREITSVLTGVRAGADYWYTNEYAWLVKKPQLRYLDAAFKQVALVSPGNTIFNPDTTCQTRVTGECYVTVCRFLEGSELPWDATYNDAVAVQLQLVEDLKQALHGREVNEVQLFVSDRDVSGVEIDGWAVAQVQVTYDWNAADPR